MAVTFISGGQRSGKSSYAQQLAEASSKQPVYLATARHWDEDFSQRIERHQRDRGPQWTTVEEEKHLGRVALESGTVLPAAIPPGLQKIFNTTAAMVRPPLQGPKTDGKP